MNLYPWLLGFALLTTGFDSAAETVYSNGAPNQADGADISGFLAADNFTISAPYSNVTSVVFWSSANLDPYQSQFSGSIGWGIFANDGGAPGSLLFSGADDAPLLTATGNQIYGTEEWQVQIALPSVGLTAGTYWLGLHEGALGTPDDGTEIYWDTTGSGTGSVGMVTADLSGSGGWFADGLDGGNSADLAFEINGTIPSGTTSAAPEPSSIFLAALGCLIFVLIQNRLFPPVFPQKIRRWVSAARTTTNRCPGRFRSFGCFSVLAITLPGVLCGQLTHSRFDPGQATIFDCCNSDGAVIKVVLVNDPSNPITGPSILSLQQNGGGFATVLVNGNGTLTPSDPGNPYQSTVTSAFFGGMDPTYQPFDGTFTNTFTLNSKPIATVTLVNSFVFDYYWFPFIVHLPVTSLDHVPVTFTDTVYVLLNTIEPQDLDRQGTCPQCGGQPMAEYAFNSMLASLAIADTPLSYTPPVGPAFSLKLSYSQTDVNAPNPAPYSNFGPNWSFNWMSFISQGPATTNDIEAVRYIPGGGQERFNGWTPGPNLNCCGLFNGTIWYSAPHESTRASLMLITGANVARPDRYWLANPDGSIDKYEYFLPGDTTRYLSSHVDPQGNALTFNYAANSAQLTSIVDALGQATNFFYDIPTDALKITRVTDPFGRTAKFTYDAQGRLTSITDPVGIVSQFAYAPASNFIQTLTTPYGKTSFQTGQSAGSRFIQATDPLGQTERLEYDAQLPTSVRPASEPVAPSGVAVNNANLNLYNSFYWDKQAYAAAQSSATGSAAYYAQATITHWALGPRGVTAYATSLKKPLENRVWTLFQGQSNPDYVDPTQTALPAMTARVLDDGSTQLYQKTYNTFGEVTQSIDPVGRQTNYTYGPDAGLASYANTDIDLLSVTQQNGAGADLLFSATYNSQHLPLTTTDAAGQVTTTTYDAVGQPLTITDPKNETTTMAYSASGYLQSVTGAIPGSTTSYTYDAAGRVKTVTDSEGYTLTNTYDAINRLTQQAFPDGTTRTTVHDRLSIGSTTDRLGRTTTYTNDALGRVVSTKDPLGRVTNQTWCRCGSIASLEDGNGNTTRWAYDLQGRVSSKVYADGKGDSFVYEKTTSRLHAQTDALAQTKTYQYLADDNLAAITYSNARNPTPNVMFAYDPVYNRRVSMTDGTGVTNYSYYPVNGALGAGKLENVSGPIANSTINYTYDLLGRMVGRSINGAANEMSLTYDALGHVVSETNGLGAFTTAYVDETNRPLSLTYPNGQSTVYQYFNNLGDQRLKEIKNLAGSTTLSQFDYAYDAEGQILSWEQSAGTYALGYDLAGQLTSASFSGTIPKTYNYAYDPGANRTDEIINGAAAPANSNTLNELVSRTGASPRSFAYDATGNMLSSSGVGRSSTNYSYQWDAENRLIAINYSPANQQTLFSYDGLGRRVKIVEKSAGAVTATRQFVWDGLSLAEERDASGNLVKRFYAQGQVNGVTGYFYTRDHLGSIRGVTNSSGALVARYDYDPYGRRTPTSGVDVADFGFTGHFYHPQSGLHLAPYRAYNADLGRWLSRDPIAEADGPSLSVYAENEPIAEIDQLGLNPAYIPFGMVNYPSLGPKSPSQQATPQSPYYLLPVNIPIPPPESPYSWSPGIPSPYQERTICPCGKHLSLRWRFSSEDFNRSWNQKTLGIAGLGATVGIGVVGALKRKLVPSAVNLPLQFYQGGAFLIALTDGIHLERICVPDQ